MCNQLDLSPPFSGLGRINCEFGPSREDSRCELRERVGVNLEETGRIRGVNIERELG